MRIVFAGTPDFAATQLRALIDQCRQHAFDIVAVYTQPDRRAGRGKKLLPSPVKQLALDHDISVEQPASLKSDEDANILALYNADIMVVVAYGLLLPEKILSTPQFGCINVHASLLPRWRGAAPVERAIEAGDTETGITIMQMDAGLDTGDMLLTGKCDISSQDSGDSLRHKLNTLGATLLLESLQQIAAGETTPTPQDSTLANYAHKLAKQEAEINWSLTTDNIDQKIRAFYSSMPCYTLLNEQRIKVLEARLLSKNEITVSSQHPIDNGTIINIDKQGMDVKCGEGVLRLVRLQLPGAKALFVHDILNGKPDLFRVGQRFTNPRNDTHRTL